MIVLKGKIMKYKFADFIFADRPFDAEGYDRIYLTLPKHDEPPNGSFKPALRYYSKVNLAKSLNEIYHSFNGTTRAKINRAKKSTMKIKIGSKKVNDFIALQNEFMQKKGFWLDEITNEDIEIPASNNFLTTAYMDSILIEGAYFTIEDGHLYTLLKSSRRIFADKELDETCSNASRYIYYKTIEYAKEHGAKDLILQIGKYKDSTDGITQFKLGFNGELFQKPMWYKTYNPYLNIASMIGILGRV